MPPIGTAKIIGLFINIKASSKSENSKSYFYTILGTGALIIKYPERESKIGYGFNAGIGINIEISEKNCLFVECKPLIYFEKNKWTNETENSVFLPVRVGLEFK